MATSVAEGSAATAEFDMDEVKKHDKEDDCWLVIGGKVYDVTAYLPEHPGGADIMLGSTGKLLSEVDIDRRAKLVFVV